MYTIVNPIGLLTTGTTYGTITLNFNWNSQMANCDKLLEKAKRNTELRFAELCDLVKCYGFVLARINGSHHMYKHSKLKDVINMQPDKNGKAKRYQVKQVLRVIDDLGDN